MAPFVVAYSNPDSEKVSTYECGFNAFDDSRMRFDVRFYLVAILFIIFDLEVAFLFPWAVVFGELGWFGFWSMMIFLGVLTVGFVYEWNKGALEWDLIDRDNRVLSPNAEGAALFAARAGQPCPGEGSVLLGGECRAGRQGLSRHLHG